MAPARGANRRKPSRKQKVEAARELEILAFQPLVRQCAAALRHRIPASIPIADMISEGQLGLIEALDKWNPKGGMHSKKAWCKFTIRQRIIDAFRRANYRWEVNQINGVQVASWRHFFQSNSPEFRLEFPSETRPETFAQDIQQHVHMGQLNRLLWRYIDSTPNRAQRLALASYLNGKKLSELGEQLGISESGACLIRQTAVRELRRRLEDDGFSLEDLLGS